MQFVVPAAVRRASFQFVDDIRLSCRRGQRRQQVRHVDDFAADASAGRSGPADHERHADTAFPCRALVAPERRRAAFRPHILIGAVVGRVDDDRILIEAGLRKLVEQLADVAVMFLQAVAINVFATGAGLALRRLLQMDEDMLAR